MDEELNMEPQGEYEPVETAPDSSPPSEGEVEGDSRRNWLFIGGIILALLLAVLALWALLRAFQAGPEEPPVSVESFITITFPAQGAIVPVPEAVIVQGQGGGLFENNVVVQALDQSGTVLAEQPTTVDAAEVGGSGNWSTELVIPVQPGTRGLIFVFSSSPEDGSIMASASVEVTYGEDTTVSSEIVINEPTEGAVLDISNPVRVSGTGQGLFEGNVVVQALDEGGNLIVENPTTMPSEEVGGAGLWSIELAIDTTPGSKGTIRAFSPSPADGSVMAEARVSVTYGEEESEPTETPPAEATPTEPPPGSELIGPTWTVELILPQIYQPVAGLVQELEEPIEDTELTLIFREEGNADGSGGCNTFTARYELTDTEITILDLTATRLACTEPAGVMEQEAHYFDLLERAEEYFAMQQGDERTLVLVEVREEDNDLEQPLLEYKDE